MMLRQKVVYITNIVMQISLNQLTN